MPPEQPAVVPARPVVRAVRATLAQLVGPAAVAVGDAERDPTTWAALRAQLDEVPPEARGRPWREASVLADLTFRQRPSRAYRQLSRMRARRLGQGSAEDFEEFWGECRRALAPYTLNPHGYHLALGSREAGDVWSLVAQVSAAVAALGHPCLLDSGTLLGVVREGEVLAHDDDVDLAVVLDPDDSPDAAGAARQWQEFRTRALAAGLLDAEFEERRPGHCRVAAPDGLMVDLFPAWPGGGRMYVWPHTHGDLAVDDVLPPARRQVHGVEVLVPRHPERLLEVNYGPGWRTPDPTFRFDWAHAHERFAGFLGHLGSRTTHDGAHEPDGTDEAEEGDDA